MISRPIIILLLAGLSSPSLVQAQTQVLSSSPPLVEYQYQMYYPRWWNAWPGPGMSIGGSLPANSRQGISSFYGAPFAVPLGAGVYMNPFAYASRLPAVPGAPLNIGLSASTTPPPPDPRRVDPAVTPISQTVNPSPVGNNVQTNSMPFTPVRLTVPMSSPAAFQRSFEMEAFGDEKMQLRNWTQAYVNYRNAANTADDRASAHARLALASAALGRFPEAVHEFKRAISLDPMTGKSGETLASIFGLESQVVRTALVNDVARWARGDLRDQDRLFLLGTILLYNEDTRARDVLQAALKVTGSGDHILALLAPAPRQSPLLSPPPIELDPEAPKPDPPAVKLPTLHQQPLALNL